MSGYMALGIIVVVLYFLIQRGSGTGTNTTVPRGTQRIAVPADAEKSFLAQVHGIYHPNVDGSSRQKIIRDCYVGEELVLVPEPTNRFDPDAIKICRKNGEQLGYWDGNHSRWTAEQLADGVSFRVKIEEIYAFEDKPNKRGVQLRVDVLRN